MNTRPGFEHVFTTGISGDYVTRTVRARILEGPDAGSEVTLGHFEVMVGSSADADLQLTDPAASRLHLDLRLVDDGVQVRDRGSTNGTWLDEERLQSAVIATQQTLRIGTSRLGFVSVEEPAEGMSAPSFGELTSDSIVMRPLFAALTHVALTDTTVLLEGETGVGKDVIARELHSVSARSSRPFIVLDCTAISPQLVASELFGHRRGAFTGADEDRVGVFEAAHGGTLFIDEIGEFPLEMQASLLRVLENREVRRVGDTTVRKVDVRVIAATNRSLANEAEARRFREDLYHRIAVVRLIVPPLRARGADVLSLADRFLREDGHALDDLRPADRGRLQAYAWPGNVRELRNVILRTIALSGEEGLRLRLPDTPTLVDARSAAQPVAPGASAPSAAARPDRSRAAEWEAPPPSVISRAYDDAVLSPPDSPAMGERTARGRAASTVGAPLGLDVDVTNPSGLGPVEDPTVPGLRPRRPDPPNEPASLPALDELTQLELKDARKLLNARFELAYGAALLELHDGNVTKAAEPRGWLARTSIAC